jgi:hypothetical protein
LSLRVVRIDRSDWWAYPHSQQDDRRPKGAVEVEVL